MTPPPHAPQEPAVEPPRERRRYNRRNTDSVTVPPYFAAFERIADALEDIAKQLHDRQITLPRPASRR